MEKRDPLKEVTNTGTNIEPQGAVDNVSKPPGAVAELSKNKENGFDSKAKIDVSECTGSTGEPKIVNVPKTEDDLCELFNNLHVEELRRSQELLEEKSNPKLDTENKDIEKEEPVATPPNLQFQDQATRQVLSVEEYKSPTKQDAECINESHSECSVYTKLEDILTEKQEPVKEQVDEEICGSPQNVLKLDSDVQIKSSTFSEPKFVTEQEKLEENLNFDCKAESQKSDSKSNEKVEPNFDQKSETFQTHIPLDVATSQLGLRSGEIEENQLQSGEIEQKLIGSGSKFEEELETSGEKLDSYFEVKLQHEQDNKSGEIEQKPLVSGSKFEEELEIPEEKLGSDFEVKLQPEQDIPLELGEIEQKQSESGSKFEEGLEIPEVKLDSHFEVKLQPEQDKPLESGEIEQKQSGSASKLEEELEIPEVKLDSHFEVKLQPEQDKPLESGEIEQKQSGSGSHFEVKLQPEQDKPLESGEIEQKQSGSGSKLEEELDSHFEVKLQPEQDKPLEPGEIEQKQSGSGFEFEKETEKPEEKLDSNSAVKVYSDQENNRPPIHSESNYVTESDPEQESENLNCEIENPKTDEAESCAVDIFSSTEETEFNEAKCSLLTEVIPDNKTEKLEKITTQFQEITDENTKVVTDSDTTYINQDDEHHLDSGVDSIEESYTKSPKSPVPFEESETGEAQVITSGEEVNLPENKLHLTHEPIERSLDQITSDEESKSDEPVQDKIPQPLDQSVKSRIEEEIKLVNEPKEPEEDRPIISLAHNQISDKKPPVDIDSLKAKMADLSEKLSEQQQENSDLKLQLNAIQQAKASLELEIRQKEEVIIKTQAEALKNEQTFKQEIKQLREKLKENSKLIEKDGSKELEDQLKEAKVREAKAVAELHQKTKDDLNYQKIMEEYENTIATRFADYQKLKEEHETATRHLANIELAFSDVHQKYERTKALLEGFKTNEETLNMALQASEKTCKQHEERYESLKAHAKGQIEKSNKEILMLRDKYEMDVNKLKAIIKRLEIKCSSLQLSLQQKTEECAALSALCDEVTGKKV